MTILILAILLLIYCAKIASMLLKDIDASKLTGVKSKGGSWTMVFICVIVGLLLVFGSI